MVGEGLVGYTSLPDPTYMITLVERGADLLLNDGRIGPGMADALKVEARRQADVNHFYGLIVLQVRSPADPLSRTQVHLEREED
jgi:hypothetical protein